MTSKYLSAFAQHRMYTLTIRARAVLPEAYLGKSFYQSGIEEECKICNKLVPMQKPGSISQDAWILIMALKGHHQMKI